jgi:hypothetical protein
VQGAREALAEAQKQAEILRDRLNQLTDNSWVFITTNNQQLTGNATPGPSAK